MLQAMAAVSIGLASAIFAFAIGAGGTGSILAAVVVGLLGGGAVGALFYLRLPLDPRACSRGLLLVSGVATLLALAQLARLSVFMIDSSRAGYSSMPASEWETQHSCLSAYYVAGREVSSTPNVYDDKLYSLPSNPAAPRVPRKLGIFNIDVYEYPPPFLILPRLLGLLTTDFERTRGLWFGLTGGLLLLVMTWIARTLGPTFGTRALLLSPLVWLSVPMISTLQKGNVQAIVIAGSLLAMLLFERRRWAAGGLVLAFLTLGKLYPGMLILFLLARRQWRAVAWTAAMAVGLVAVSVIDVGWRPYDAFVDHMPGLLSGEAFPAFRRPMAIAGNYSIPGLVFKLKLFGISGMSFGTMKLVGWLYTLIVIAATVWAARRSWRNDEKPLVWMAVLILATLRSPFLPQAYAGLPPLWLLTLLGARATNQTKALAAVLGGWIAFNLYWPTDWPMDPRLLALVTGVPQALTIALPAFALFAERQAASEHVASDRLVPASATGA